MTITRVPFVNYTIGEKDPLKGKILTVRLNPEDYKDLVKSMIILNISMESTALKFLVDIGLNVVLNQLPTKSLKWLTDGARRVDSAKLNRLQRIFSENVTQENAKI